jgi:hypothetical protein
MAEHVKVKPSAGARRKPPASPPPQIWIITDGSAGNENQGIAVAEAVGRPFALKRVGITGTMRLVPSAAGPAAALGCVERTAG